MAAADQQQHSAPSAPPRPVVGIFYPLLLVLLLAVTAAALLGAASSGLLAGNGWAWPSARAVPHVLGYWATHPGNPAAAWPPGPRPGPTVVTYTMATLVGGVEAAAAVRFSVWRRRVRDRRAEGRTGLADHRKLDARLGQQAVTESAVRLRPSLADTQHPDPDQVGARFAVQRGGGSLLYATHEDSKLVVAPVRMGKTGRQAVADILRAPGAVLATSTRFDLLELTMIPREDVGRVMVFDPEGRTPWKDTVKWPLIPGCSDYDTALRRAIAICSARPLNDTKNSGYFGGQAEGVLAALLHAAALSHAGPTELRSWTTTHSRKPVDILDTHPRAALGVAGELAKILDSAASSQDTNGGRAILSTLALLLRPLASPATRAAVDPGGDDDVIDIDAFLRDGRDTLFLVSRGRGNSAAPIVNALAKEVLHQADILSQHPTATQLELAYGDLRLDPPLRCVLDEAPNVTPLDDLAQRMADSGGRGIEMYVYVQSRGQLRQRWGQEEAIEIWDNASVKLILGGLANSRDLEEMSRLLPQRAIDQASIATGRHRDEVTVSQRWQNALRANEIRELDDGQALLLYRNLTPAVVDLPGWWETDLAEQVQHSRRAIRRKVAASTRRVGRPPETEADEGEGPDDE